jgi:hypothetical protein
LGEFLKRFMVKFQGERRDFHMSSEDYMILGETLDSEEKLKCEIEGFEYFYNSFPSIPDSWEDAVWEYIQTRPWNNNVSDLRAFFHYHELEFSKGSPESLRKSFFDAYLETRGAKMEALAQKRYRAEGMDVHMPEDRIDQVQLWDQKADGAAQKLSEAVDLDERKGLIQDLVFYQKAYLLAQGLRPCQAKDCPRFVTEPEKKYCSVECQEKEEGGD